MKANNNNILSPIKSERGCVVSTSRSMSKKCPEASGVFQQPLIAKLLRLVFDTAALQGSA
jgi:hypothetical protein